MTFIKVKGERRPYWQFNEPHTVWSCTRKQVKYKLYFCKSTTGYFNYTGSFGKKETYTMSPQKKTLRYLAAEIIIALWNCQIFKISKFLAPLWQTSRNNFFQSHRLQTSLKQRRRQQKLYRKPQRPSRGDQGVLERLPCQVHCVKTSLTASFTIFIEFRSSIPHQ